MTLLAPGMLWWLLGVVALAAAYVVMQQRRRHYAVRFTNLDLLASVAPRRPGWRRHVPAALMALALVSLIVSLARPVTEVRVPKDSATIVVVIDVSASMSATDVKPDRLSAARDAAQEFVDALPEGMRVGLVVFDGRTRVLSMPTEDLGSVSRLLPPISVGPGTATGDAIMTALDAIETDNAQRAAAAPSPTRSPPPSATPAPGASPSPGAEPEDPAAEIVLLSDGHTTVGRPPLEAAQVAAERNIPVNTIAFGTSEGVVRIEGRLIEVPSDPAAMSAVADITGGSFFEAFTAEGLRQVYDDIGSRVGYDVEEREVGARYAGIAAGLLVLGLLGSLFWAGRVI